MRGVRETTELKRILALPQRNALAEGKKLIKELSAFLGNSDSSSGLIRPLQALALSEFYQYHGLFVCLPVGAGKTLISFLLPSIVPEKECLVIVPAKLLKKTYTDFKVLKENWIHTPCHITTYEKISTRPNLLNEIKPNVIIADECHRLSNIKSAVTRRIRRYFKNNLDTWFCFMSGTITKRSFMDWHHLIQWALPACLQPLPINYYEAREWAWALDEKDWLIKYGIGALSILGKTKNEAREGYGNLLAGVPGVIIEQKQEIENLPIEITIKKIKIPEISKIARDLESTWTTPSGIEFCDALELARHLKEVSQGFYYEWREQPKKEWLEKRRIYNSYVREKISLSRKYDTERQIQKYFSNATEIIEWLEIKDSFTPRTQAVWLTDEFIDTALNSVEEDFPWLIWVEHLAVGQRISEKYDIPFYANSNNEIYNCTSPIAIVSINSIGEGFNLQKYSVNVILSSPKLGRTWEQMLGRTHRSGQLAEKIKVYFFYSLEIQKRYFEQACKDAQYIEATTQQKQKLNLGEIKYE